MSRSTLHCPECSIIIFVLKEIKKRFGTNWIQFKSMCRKLNCQWQATNSHTAYQRAEGKLHQFKGDLQHYMMARSKIRWSKVNTAKVTMSKLHKHLWMTSDCTSTGHVQIDMSKHIKAMIEESPEESPGKTRCPWNGMLQLQYILATEVTSENVWHLEKEQLRLYE